MLQPVPISDEQRAFYARHGFVVLDEVPLIADETLLQALHASFARCFRGEFDTEIYPDEWHWRDGVSLPDVVREICNGWKSDTKIAAVMRSAEVGRLGVDLSARNDTDRDGDNAPGGTRSGWRSARVGQDDLVWKVPSTPARSNVGYHVDAGYISDQFLPVRDNSVTCWIALDDSDQETGCVEYAPGSHLLGDIVIELDAAGLERACHVIGEGGQRTARGCPTSPTSQQTTALDRFWTFIGSGGGFHGSRDLETGESGTPSQKVATQLNTFVRSIPGLRAALDAAAATRAEGLSSSTECVSPRSEGNPEAEDFFPPDLAKPCIPRGCVVIHHQNVVHGSGGNASATRHRRGLVVHLVDGACTLRKHPTYIYGRYRLAGPGGDIPREEFFPTTYRVDDG